MNVIYIRDILCYGSYKEKPENCCYNKKGKSLHDFMVSPFLKLVAMNNATFCSACKIGDVYDENKTF